MPAHLIRILLIVVVVLISSCAQKLPPPLSAGTGMLAIPMMARSEGPARDFNYYYSYSGTVPHPFEIKIIPVIGRDFSLSDVLPAGEYIVDTYTVYGVPSINMNLAVSKEVIRLDEEIPLRIEPGTILMARELFMVNVSTLDFETYTENSSWKALDDDETSDYLKRLRALEGAEGWRIGVAE